MTICVAMDTVGYFSTIGQSTSQMYDPRISPGENINKQGLLISVIRSIRFISVTAEGERPWAL